MAAAKSRQEGIVVLLTGGSGFLGTAIVREILVEASPVQVKELRVFLSLIHISEPTRLQV